MQRFATKSHEKGATRRIDSVPGAHSTRIQQVSAGAAGQSGYRLGGTPRLVRDAWTAALYGDCTSHAMRQPEAAPASWRRDQVRERSSHMESAV